MMKTLFTIAVLACTLSANAKPKPGPSQVFEDWELTGRTTPHEVYKNAGVKQVLTTYKDKKDHEIKLMQEFDKDGYLVLSQRLNKKGVVVHQHEKKYDESRKVVYTKTTTKKDVQEHFYHFTKDGKRERFEFHSNGKLRSYRIWTYNEKGKTLQEQNFNTKGLLSKIVYSYVDDKHMKTSHYNKKGKLISAQNYSCKDEGEKVELGKEEKLHCSYDSREDGMLIHVFETTDHRGQATKVVMKYREADTLLLEENYYKADGNLRFRVTYFPMKNKVKSRETFDQKNQTAWHSETEYDEKWQVTRQRTSTYGILLDEQRWHYDEKGICKKSEKTNHDGLVVQSSTVEVLAFH